MRVVSFLAVALSLFVGGMGTLVPQLLRHRQVTAPDVYRGTTSLVVVPLSGGPPHEVLRLRGQWAFPVATRDGKAVLLEHPTLLNGTSIWRVPLDGSRPTKVGWKRVFTAPAGRRPPRVPARVDKLLADGRLADASRVGDRLYAVRLNQAVSIPK